jgi:NAD(P)H-flavin reductase
MVPEVFKISRMQMETKDSFTFQVEPNQSHFSFHPGQFNMLYLFGVGEVPISISGDPTRPESLVHTVRAVGTVTRKMQNLRKGDCLGVRGPFGTSWPIREAYGHDVVIITGGIGMAPLRPAMYELIAQREKFGKVNLLYGARTPEEILYHKQIQEWRGNFDLDVEVTVDSAKEDWRGNVGVVTTLFPKASFEPEQTIAMVCGPEIMMRYCITELLGRGVPEEKIYISMERNMKCGFGLCGHCQMGSKFICKDGPVFAYPDIKQLLNIREV